MTEDSITRLHALIRRYTIVSVLPDTGSYRKITGNKTGRCIFRGCSEPIVWEDSRGGNFLCEGHYILVRQWIEEARKGLLPGTPAAVFSQDPGQQP
jgi:hypothetical protein